MEDSNKNYYTTFLTRENKSITLSDYGRLLNKIEEDIGKNDVSPQILHKLYMQLSTSKKFYSERIPDDIVTMNSEVTILINNYRERTIRIVFPQDITGPDDVSIYSSLGSACLGSSENSIVFYREGAVDYKARIKRIIFQPEKEKQFSL